MRRPSKLANARRRAHNLQLPKSGINHEQSLALSDPSKRHDNPSAGAITGLSMKEVREDLVELEALGKAVRERGPVGTPHRWWRTEKRPLAGLDVLLYMALAAELIRSPDKLKEVLVDVGSRAKAPQVGKVVAMCAMGKHPHAVVWEALDNLDPMIDEVEAA